MDFTREPIIETIITPKDGCKLVIRSSKNGGQEEFFVDAIEVVSFGSSFFYRSLDRPKAFLVPANDYEVLEVREARMVLKNVAADRSAIKIGGGKEAPMRQSLQKESSAQKEREESPPAQQLQQPQPQRRPAQREKVEREKAERSEKEKVEKIELPPVLIGDVEPIAMPEALEEGEESCDSIVKEEAAGTRVEKKRDRRRHYRRRRGGKDELPPPENDSWLTAAPEEGEVVSSPLNDSCDASEREVPSRAALAVPVASAPILSALLPPPAKLISESIERYKDKPYYRRNTPVEVAEEKDFDVQTCAPIAEQVYTSRECTPCDGLVDSVDSEYEPSSHSCSAALQDDAERFDP